MLNKVKQSQGYRDVIYNIKLNKFFEFVDGDSFKEIDISAAASATESGRSDQRPAHPAVGDLFWDKDLQTLVVWNQNQWVSVELAQEAAAARGVVAANSATNLEAARAVLQTAIDNAIAERNAAITAGDTAVTDAFTAADAVTLSSANSYTDTKVTEVLGGAPELLDTLNELADAIGDDSDFITTINSSVSAVQADVDANEAAINASLATETSARTSADNALSARIDSLEADPTTAASVTAGDAATLASANTYTDTSISNLTNGADAALDTLKEIGDALAQGDTDVTTALTASITTESTTRANADTALSDRLDVLEADPTTQTLLDAETTARTTAIATETADRISGDAATQVAANAYTDSQVATGDAAVTNSMTALVTTESAARSAADSLLSARVDVLEADPTTQTLLNNAVAGVQADVDQNEADADAAISAEETRALAAEASITATHVADEAARNQLNLHAGLAFGQLYVGDLIVA
jgi:hypothetical protein